MFPLGKAIIFAPGNASKSRSIAAYVHSGRMMLGFYQSGRKAPVLQGGDIRPVKAGSFVAQRIAG
jgi:hypothetical protein